MRIREDSNLTRTEGVFDADHAAESIRELEAQYEAGDIEPHAYFLKKQSLVKLFLKATTSPKRRRRDDDY